MFKRSGAMSRCAEMSETWSEVIYIVFTIRKCVTVTLLSVTLNRGTRAHLILGCVDHTCVTYLVEKHMYFIHMDQNPMNENPNATTRCIHTLTKTVRIMINPFPTSINSILGLLHKILIKYDDEPLSPSSGHTLRTTGDHDLDISISVPYGQ